MPHLVKHPWLFALALLTACGPGEDPEVTLTLSAPQAVTVFAGQQVEVPLTLVWEGEPRTVTVAASSTTGLTMAPLTATAGDTGGDLFVEASEEATSGELILTATGEGVAATATVQVTVVRASLEASPQGPALRGAHVQARVWVSEDGADFDGAEGVEPLGGGLYQLRLRVPLAATLGEVELPLSVNVDGQSRSLPVPVTVTDVVTVRPVDPYGTPLQGISVSVNLGAPVLTGPEGEATFTAMEAPYRLTLHDGSYVTVWEGVTRPDPSPPRFEEGLPEQRAEVEIELRDANGQVFETGNRFVQINADGTRPAGPGFAAGQGVASGSITWRSHKAELRTRFRARIITGGQLTFLSEQVVNLDANDAAPRFIPMTMAAPEVGPIHTRMTPPPGLALFSRSLTAVFSENRWDRLAVGVSNSTNIEATLENGLPRDDVTHMLVATAYDLAGRSSERTWVGARVGDLVEGALPAPPVLVSPPTTVRDDTEYVFEGDYPVFYMSVHTGSGGSARLERYYTSARRGPRPRMIALTSGPAELRLCGESYVQSVDELLSGHPDETRRPGARGCEVPIDTEYLVGP